MSKASFHVNLRGGVGNQVCAFASGMALADIRDCDLVLHQERSLECASLFNECWLFNSQHVPIEEHWATPPDDGWLYGEIPAHFHFLPHLSKGLEVLRMMRVDVKAYKAVWAEAVRSLEPIHWAYPSMADVVFGPYRCLHLRRLHPNWPKPPIDERLAHLPTDLPILLLSDNSEDVPLVQQYLPDVVVYDREIAKTEDLEARGKAAIHVAIGDLLRTFCSELNYVLAPWRSTFTQPATYGLRVPCIRLS